MPSQELDRWREIESMVDELFDLEGGEPPTLDLASKGAAARAPTKAPSGSVELRRIVAALVAEPEAGPLDRPVDAVLGELLGEAMASQERLGLGPGDEVGNYRIQGLIGEGGMGTVFLACRADGNFDQEVALKVLHRSSADERSRQRFLQERQILAGLKHPHIARLLDGGVIRHMPYLVMEHIDGLSINEFARQYELSRESRIGLFLQVCDAMRYAHRQGVIHRDLKPSNLLVEEGPGGEARVAVLDFGIALIEHAEAQVTATGQIFGTPGYMSPEQAKGERSEIDRRSDVYSLGVVLYELLSDHKPFAGTSAAEILERARVGDSIPLGRRVPGISVDLATIAETCLQPEPWRRYDSIRALAEDLESYLDGAPIAARPTGTIERWIRLARRRPRLSALVAGALALAMASLILLVVMATRHARDLRQERNSAIEARQKVEELLDFMLEDLHQGLARVGRLDLLDQVARKTLDYYEQLEGSLSIQEMRGRSVALYNAGEILESQGDYQAAVQAHDRNRQFLEQRIAVDADPSWLLELARSHGSLAGVFTSQGDSEQALRHATKAVALSSRVGDHPASPGDWPLIHFDNLAIQGWAARESRSADEALKVLEEARRFAAQQLAAREDDATWRHQSAVAESYIGLVHAEEGDLDAALLSFQRAREVCEALVIEAPANSKVREELQLVFSRLGSTYFDLGDLGAAIRLLEQAWQQADILVQLEPSNSHWLRELGVTHSSLALAWQETGELESALESLRNSLEISRSLALRLPENPGTANDLAWDLLFLGRIQRDLGKVDEAHEAWRESAQVMARIRAKSPESAYNLDAEAQALLEMGRLEEARPLIERLFEIGWKDPDLLALAAQHGLGPADAEPRDARTSQ